MCERLSASEPSIGWRNRTANREHLAVAFEHHECRALIREPAECGKRNHAIGTDHHKAFQPMRHSREPDFTTLWANAISQQQMPAMHGHTDPVAPKGD